MTEHLPAIKGDADIAANWLTWTLAAIFVRGIVLLAMYFFGHASGNDQFLEYWHTTRSQALQHLAFEEGLLPDACPKKFAIPSWANLKASHVSAIIVSGDGVFLFRADKA